VPEDISALNPETPEGVLRASIERLQEETRRVRADARLHFGLGIFVNLLSAVALNYLHSVPNVDYALEARTRELAGIRDQKLLADGQYVACHVNGRAVFEKSLGPLDDRIFANCSHWLTVAAELKDKEDKLLSRSNSYADFFTSGWINVYKSIANILFILLLNASAIVFFRTFFSKNREARFYVNEITNLDLKITALIASKKARATRSELQLALVFALAERNFIASGNEKFFVRSEDDGEKGLLRDMLALVRGTKDASSN